MVSYHDPVVVLHDFCALRLHSKVHGPGELNLLLTGAVSKLWHTVAGVYLYVCPTGRSESILIPS